MGSSELLAYYKNRVHTLGDKATKLNMFLEGCALGQNGTTHLAIAKATEFIYSELAEGNLTCNDGIEIILERLKKAMNNES